MTERVPLSRRQLLQAAGAATAALGLPRLGLSAQAPAPALSTATMMGVPFEARDLVRIGLIGCGRRGLSHLGDLAGIEKVEIRAVCDVVPEQVAKAQSLIEKAGQRRPEGYAKGDHHFEELVRRDDLDLVYIATPWTWHVPMAVAALNAGKHVGLEVPAVGRSTSAGSSSRPRSGRAGTASCSRTAATAGTRCSSSTWCGRGCSGSCSTRSARTTTTCARSSSRTRRRGCGGGPSTSAATATSIRPTAWGRWRGTWGSTRATASTTSSP